MIRTSDEIQKITDTVRSELRLMVKNIVSPGFTPTRNFDAYKGYRCFFVEDPASEKPMSRSLENLQNEMRSSAEATMAFQNFATVVQALEVKKEFTKKREDVESFFSSYGSTIVHNRIINDVVLVRTDAEINPVVFKLATGAHLTELPYDFHHEIMKTYENPFDDRYPF